MPRTFTEDDFIDSPRVFTEDDFVDSTAVEETPKSSWNPAWNQYEPRGKDLSPMYKEVAGISPHDPSNDPSYARSELNRKATEAVMKYGSQAVAGTISGLKAAVETPVNELRRMTGSTLPLPNERGEWVTGDKGNFSMGPEAEVPAPQDRGERIARGAGGVVGGLVPFIAELAVAKRLPAISSLTGIRKEMAAWEVVNQAHGGTPGYGAAQGAVFGAIGAVPARGVVENATKLVLEGAALTKIQQLAEDRPDVEQDALAFFLPFAMRGVSYASESPARAKELATKKELSRSDMAEIMEVPRERAPKADMRAAMKTVLETATKKSPELVPGNEAVAFEKAQAPAEGTKPPEMAGEQSKDFTEFDKTQPQPTEQPRREVIPGGEETQAEGRPERLLTEKGVTSEAAPETATTPAQPRPQEPASTQTNWIESLPSDSKDQVLKEMRRLFDESERQYAKAKELSPSGGSRSVGGAHMDPIFKASAIDAFLRSIRSGSTPEQAMEAAKTAAREAVANWNKKTDYQTRRSEGTVDPYIEDVYRRFVNVEPPREPAPKAPTAAPEAPQAVEEPKTATEPGVTPERPVSDPNVIGINKAQITEKRADWGMEELPAAERRTWEEEKLRAKAEGYDQSAMENAKAALKAKRAPTTVEHAGMVLKAADLSNRLTAAEGEMAVRIEAGDRAGVKVATERANAILEELETLTRAGDMLGSEAGRSLVIRKMLINRESMELAPVVQRAAGIKGSKLTPEQHMEFKKLTDDYAKALEQVKAERTRGDQMAAERDKALADKALADEIAKAKGEVAEPTKYAKARQARAVKRQDMEAQLAAMLTGRTTALGVLDPQALWLVGKIAVSHIQDGASTIAEIAGRMRAKFPAIDDNDIVRGLAARNPKAQEKAASEATKRVAELKTTGRLLDDMEKAAAGALEPKPKSALAPSPVRKLRKIISAVRSQLYKSSGDSAALERGIRTLNEASDALESAAIELKTKAPDAPSSESLTTAIAKVRDLPRLLRVREELASIEDQVATGEFIVKEKPERAPKSKELQKAETQLEIARKAIKTHQESLRPKGVLGHVGEAIATLRTAKATLDVSATLRQNVVSVFSHPIKAFKVMPDVFRATFSERKASEIEARIRNDPDYLDSQQAKLEIIDRHGSLSKREEVIASSWLERVPGYGRLVRGSERHMTTMGNLMRFSLFKDFLAEHQALTLKDKAAYANWLNVSSGRGNLGSAATAANILSGVFFAPRLAISRIQTPYLLVKSLRQSPVVRKQIARDLGGFVATGMSVLGAAYLYSLTDDRVKVGFSPRDSDFGKMRFGDTRVDIWGGFQQPARLLSRVVLTATDAAGWTGEDLRDIEKNVDPWDLATRFAAFKLAPQVTVYRELVRGKTAVGGTPENMFLPNSISPRWHTLANTVIPLVLEDVYDGYKSEGWAGSATVGTLSALGVGMNTYEDSETATRGNIRKMIRNGELGKAKVTAREWNAENPKSRITEEKITDNGRAYLLAPKK